MREIVTKDFAWKLFSVALAVVIWLTVQTTRTERSGSPRPLEEVTTSTERPTILKSQDSIKTRTFPNVPVLAVSGTGDVRDFKVNPKIVDIVIGGRADALITLQESDLRVMVDLTNFEQPKDSRKRVRVALPPGFTVMEVVPPEVEVFIPIPTDSNP
ncbi:MAG: hypothetical protein IH623_08590 [Verrucomicrobia bacterium]|nr:hypothetical protein [Verrucomicrobiota bacterium]